MTTKISFSDVLEWAGEQSGWPEALNEAQTVDMSRHIKHVEAFKQNKHTLLKAVARHAILRTKLRFLFEDLKEMEKQAKIDREGQDSTCQCIM